MVSREFLIVSPLFALSIEVCFNFLPEFGVVHAWILLLLLVLKLLLQNPSIGGVKMSRQLFEEESHFVQAVSVAHNLVVVEHRLLFIGITEHAAFVHRI